MSQRHRCLIALAGFLSLATSGSAFSLDPTETRFFEFFPQYRTRFTSAAANCQPEIYRYRHNIETLSCTTPCSCAADCILAQSTPTMSANMASANVLLGLMPVLLPYIGPMLFEVAMFSQQRPVLAILLALGTPALNIGQLFSPFLRDLYRVPTSTVMVALVDGLEDQNQSMWTLISFTEYFFAIVAIFTQIAVAVLLDLRTIIAWRCKVHFLVLMWLLLGLLPHLVGIVSFQLTLQSPPTPPTPPDPPPPSLESRSNSSSTAQPVSIDTTMLPSLLPSWRGRVQRLLASELTSCSCPERLYKRKSLPSYRPSPLADAFNWVAAVLTLIHTIFGIVVLSSVLFISVADALLIVLALTAPAALCRIIILFELTGMQKNALKAPVPKTHF